MNLFVRSLIVAGVSLGVGAAISAEEASAPIAVESPNGEIVVTVRLDEGGRPVFDVARRDVPLVSGSLGLEFVAAEPLGENLTIVETRRASRDETYAIPVGKASSARDRHEELIVSLEETAAPRRKLDVAFRAFDDAIAFRYRIPEQQTFGKFVIADERTRLAFRGDPHAKILPLKNYTTPYEAYYETKKLSEIADGTLIGLPLLLEHPEGVWLAVTEAGLTDYAGTYLSPVEGEPGMLRSRLSPLPRGSSLLHGVSPEDSSDVPANGAAAKVVGATPFESPWRIVMIADDPGRLIESNVVFHLSDPSAIEDPSWIVPGKTTFPWWNHYVLEGVDFEPGVNTATMKRYIDFCAEQGIPYHSLDGLDVAWYGGPIHPAGPTDVTTAVSTIDLPELLRYAKSKGVRLRLWMHWKALQPQLDEAFRIYEEWGIEGVMIDFMDRDDQEMVRWYHEVAEKAAKHRLTVTWHGAYKPTGMERTWPNVLSYEAVLNQEYNKWQPPGVKGTPPSHNLDVAFARMLAGPLDYHQGGMRNVLPENYRFRDVAPPVQGTRGHQLAMYVVYQNHLPMMADYPAAYRGQPGLEFLVDVPTTWDETRVLHAELDRCLVIARRKGDAWYVGGMTAPEPRRLELPLDFLDDLPGEGPFEVDLYQDDEAKGPTAVTRSARTIRSGETLAVAIPASGGFAAKLTRKGR